MKRGILFFAFMVSASVYSQQSQPISPSILANSKQAIQSLGSKLDTNSFLLYNMHRRFVMVSKVAKEYRSFLVEAFFDANSHATQYRLLHEKALAANPLLDKVFQGKDCSKGFKQLGNESGQSYLYYNLKINGSKHCEFFLPVLGYNAHNEYTYPISNELNKYLFEQLIKEP